MAIEEPPKELEGRELLLEVQRLRKEVEARRLLGGEDEKLKYARNKTEEQLRGDKRALEAMNMSLEQRAGRDHLTGLRNRRGMEDAINGIFKKRRGSESEKEGAERKNPILSLLRLDVDNFKAINDTFGHTSGDDVLVQAARYLESIVRDTDPVCRIGGEEFDILFPNASAEMVMDKILERNNKKDPATDSPHPQIKFKAFLHHHGDRSIEVTFSGGVVELHDPELLKEAEESADKELYRAKHEGKNRIFRADDAEKEKGAAV